MSQKTLGQIAYESYSDYRGWKSFNGESLPQWDEQNSSIKKAWQFAAENLEREIMSRNQKDYEV